MFLLIQSQFNFFSLPTISDDVLLNILIEKNANCLAAHKKELSCFLYYKNLPAERGPPYLSGIICVYFHTARVRVPITLSTLFSFNSNLYCLNA